MAVDERSRLQLAEALKHLLGDEERITMMELLPPVGWADVATKQDLRMIDLRFDSLETRMDARFDGLEARMDARFQISESRMEARFEKGFRQVVVTMMSLFITGFIATILAGAVAVAVR